MRFRATTAVASLAALAIALPATAQRQPGQSPQDVKSQDKDRVEVACPDGEGDPDLIVFHGDLTMWPPNHKYQDTLIEAVGDDGDESVTLTTRATHDEYVEAFTPGDEEDRPGEEEVGAGNTTDDARPFFATDSGTGTASTTHDLRSERSGRGDGRTYTIDVTATFDGEECTTSFAVEVPHDMRSSRAPAKEDKTGSTGPNR